MKYRFQIAASQLHRGRIRISYDPFMHVGGEAPENVVYSRIIDLATNRDFEMVVAWNHPHSWLRVKDRLGTDLYGNPQGTTTLNKEFHNGQIRIEVVNELTSPNPSLGQPVYINIFASAGEDFELASPTDDILQVVEYEPQSGYEPQADGEEIVDEQDNIPESPTPIASIGTEASLDDPNAHVFFGESFKSIRALLKRYCYHMSYVHKQGNSHSYIIESNFPVEPGQGASPRHLTDAEADPPTTMYTYSMMTYLNWFTPCYVGWRGGLRSKYIKYNPSGHMTVRRFTEPVHQVDCGIKFLTVNISSDHAVAYESAVLSKVGAGHDVTLVQTDGAAEVEFPFYSYRRFAPARRFLNGTGTSGNEWLGENAGHLVANCYDSTGTPDIINRYVAAGDDFSLFMFIGQPGVLKRAKPLANGSTAVLPPY